MAEPGLEPIEIYQGAIDLIMPVVAGIGENQMGLPTPCAEWSVLQLVNHNLAIQSGTLALLTGRGTGSAAPDLTVALPEGPASALLAVTGPLMQTLKSIDLDKPLETDFGLIPASSFIMFPMADLVIHKWDLAKATGQNSDIDASLAEICFRVLAPAADQARENGECGPEVPVPPTASIQDRLLGMSGRQP